MTEKRIAIACQGGGSQCAFVAGALKALFARRIQDRYRIVALSGTSGGAFTAALAWQGLLLEARGDRTPVEDRIIACWRDLTAQTRVEIAVDAASVQLMRQVQSGLLPSIARSPSSVQFRLWAAAVSRLVARPEFTDLRALLVKHLDHELSASLTDAEGPVMLAGAVDVLDGTFKIFTSLKGEITVDALLASAAIPNLFPAVWVDGHPYWDGIFSSNPPILAFLQETYVGRGKLPEEIWVLQVNPWRYEFVPELPDEIFDRRNHLAGNLSLRHELQVVQMLNVMLAEHALTDQFRSRFQVDVTEPIQVRFIRMSAGLLNHLDYASKLSRQPTHITRLIADGEAQANAFLNQYDGSGRTADAAGAAIAEAPPEMH